MHPPAYQTHLQWLRQQAVPLAQALVEAWVRGLRDPALGLSSEEARRAGTWAVQMSEERAALTARLVAAIHASMEEASRPAAATQSTKGAGTPLSFDALTLVDEEQAERDIETSRVAQQIDLRCESEWRDLFSLACGAHGSEPSLDPPRYPAHPLVIACGVAEAVNQWAILPVQRSTLMRLSGAPACEAMGQLYRQAAQALRDAHVQPAALRARPLQAATSRTGAPEASPSLRSTHAAAPDAQQLVHQLFERMGRDPLLDESLQASIRRLEAAVCRLAAADPTLLTNEAHPTWSLINALAEHRASLPAGTDPRSTDFDQFVQPLVERIASAPQTNAEVFADALSQVQDFIAQDDAHEFERLAEQRDALSQAEREQVLLPLLRQQVEQQLGMRRLAMPEPLRQFFVEGWTQVMARTMVAEGTDSAESQAAVSLVDELLDTLQRPADERSRGQMLRRLPPLIDQLKRGMALIDWPEAKRQATLDALMSSHERLLFSPVPLPDVAPPPPPPAASTDWLESDLNGLFEHASDRWKPSAPLDTNVGMLPTVPMALDAEVSGADATRWTQQLKVDTRCKLFIQGRWTTARLTWRSDNGQFYMFSSNLSGGSHSLTQRALQRLRAEGLATELSDPNLLQRALKGWMEDSQADGA
ncbi:DUF1631 family protein [Inhella sp.]|uniref:DUF1631 family protein n=1 Tax=Inhella sp. TaxID=1921806 RepID=UPI0035ADD065